ncbi:ISAs1 family transposase [Dyella sp. M7H15-1]|uniref:ISAs1 family transposase n=1 Tax=Dyella sp. M7H15-1 TaxID=2501295 RepID=UPI0013E8CD7A|nr:ISAs1 family transposase [Dyella sp. M7H15-1]
MATIGESMGMLPNPMPFFSNLADPRRQTRNKLHKLSDILMITLCAVVCGVEDWVGIEDFGCENEAWLCQFLELPHGIPSHDTLSDVIGRLDRRAFAVAFAEWVSAGLPALAGKQVAIDGKTLRGSRDGERPPTHLMSAFATQARLVLAVQDVPDKSNEIKAIPALLQQIELTGAVVSMDAIRFDAGCCLGAQHSTIALSPNGVTISPPNARNHLSRLIRLTFWRGCLGGSLD